MSAPTLTPAPAPTRFPDRIAVIPHFTFDRVLARGGMGCVSLFRRDRDGEPFAVKSPRRHPDLIARFHREIDLIRRLDHPNVIRIVQASNTDEWPWYMTAYYSRGTLDEWKRRWPIEVSQVVRGILSLTRGLRHAHDKGIVHRDIKPGNILIRSPQRWVLADWGLGRSMDEESNLTEFDARLGTPGYRAPEQEFGLNEQVGPATDVFAIGRILHTLVNGYGRPMLPDLATIISRCLAESVRVRYPHAGALAADLCRVLAR